jgi:vancomycin permeability regulator SanA
MIRIRRKVVVRILGVLVLGGILLVWGPSCIMRQSTTRYQFAKVEDIPHQRVALVFGARVRNNGTLTPILQDRVDAAVALYKAGTVQKLLMSGDSGKISYNEVAAMQRVAEAEGVPATDISLDYAGFSTYESCYRAKVIFGLTDAVLVTQKYHMSRALFTCRKLGVTAVGYALQDWALYPDLRIPYTERELLASTKAMGQLYITHGKPTYLGSFVGVP